MKKTSATCCYECGALVLAFRKKRAPKCPKCGSNVWLASVVWEVVIGERSDYYPPKLKEDPNQKYLPGFEGAKNAR